MATLLQRFESSVFLDGTIASNWIDEFSARQSSDDVRTGWAGYCNTLYPELPNGNYITIFRFLSTGLGKDVSITLNVGPKGIVNSENQYPLAYKFFNNVSPSDEYINPNPSTPKDGTFVFDGKGQATIKTKTGQEFIGRQYWLVIWNGGSSYRDNMTAIDRGDIEGQYNDAVTLKLNKNTGVGGTSTVYAYIGETLPDITVPSKEYKIICYKNDGTNTSITADAQAKFNGYSDSQTGGTMYYDSEGKGLIELPGSYDRTLYAQWEEAQIQLPSISREGYSFAGWYTSSEGGSYVGMAGDKYALTSATTYLYARWKELTYSWSFNPVTAKGNSADSVVRGIWSGFVKGREVLCAACNGYLWELEKREQGEWGKTACGAIDTSSDVFMFGFSGNMYLLNGKEYKVWDGDTLSDVTGYRPMVAVSIPPAGGGTSLEQVNKLCGQRRARFSPDGSEKTFVLPEKSLTSIDYVKSMIDGSDMEGWTPNVSDGKVTFTEAPPEGTNSIEIGWSVAEDTADEIRAMRYAELYNGAQDSRIFVYGDGTNRCFYTGIDYDGIARADYFPDLNVAHVGDENTPITAMIRHYNRLLCFKLDSAWSIDYSTITLTDGSVTAGFYVTPINRSIGNCALGQAVLVENKPRTLDGRSIIEWKATSSSGYINASERNAERISQRVDNTIRTFDLESAKCYYDKYAHEYYVIGADGTALVQNIDVDAWYTYTGMNVTCLINYKDELYAGTQNGYLMHISNDYFSDNGEKIDAYWESGSMAFDSDFKRKYSAMLWVGIRPDDNGYLAVTAETDRKPDFAEYFANSVAAGQVPKMTRLKLKAKKFTYYKLILSNNTSDTTATIVSADIRVRGTGYVR